MLYKFALNAARSWMFWKNADELHRTLRIFHLGSLVNCQKGLEMDVVVSELKCLDIV